jgi:hypothetical protein
MKIQEEEELEKFVRANKDKFDIYEPESEHNQHFFNKLINKFKAVINIVPYLVKLGLATLFIFIFSFLIWKTWLCPPLTSISMKYWKAEHDYKRQISRTTRLTFHSITIEEDKAEFEAELQKFDETYKNLKKQLKGNPTEDNIAEMLRFYQEKLLTLQENIQNYTNTTIQGD